MRRLDVIHEVAGALRLGFFYRDYESHEISFVLNVSFRAQLHL